MSLRPANFIVLLVCHCLLLANIASAHPPSGIVIDHRGRVFFLYRGLVRLEASGQLTTIEEDTGGHWLAMDEKNIVSKAAPTVYKRVTTDGSTFLFGDGGPLTMGSEGNLYYAGSGSQEDPFSAGVKTVVKLPAQGRPAIFAPQLQQKLAELQDGITGLAAGPDGSIYAATWNGIVKLNRDGSIAKVINPVQIKDCDSDPADHNPANASSPLLRGLAVDSGGTVYVAATSCHRVLKITADGQVTSIVKSERPWSPTGVALSGDDIYV